MNFDFMSKDNLQYEFNCRIVRFKFSDNTYECIITDLDRGKFSIKNTKKLYNKHWALKHHLEK